MRASWEAKAKNVALENKINTMNENIELSVKK
jgi:hypothetical protein